MDSFGIASRRHLSKQLGGRKDNRSSRPTSIEPLEQRLLMASITWANAAGKTNWNSGSSWVGGKAPGSADIAVFPSAATVVQPALTANASVAGITVNNSGANYSIGGSSFTLTVDGSGVSVTSPSSTSASTSTISPKIALSANATFSATNNGSGANAITLTGTFNAGTRTLTKSGSGTVNLNGAMSGNGAITVSAGTLVVTSTIPSGRTVTVANGAALSGTGTAAGAVTVNSGGRLAPGPVSASGIINTGNLKLNSGSNFGVGVNNATAGSGYDRVNVTGSVNVAGSNLVLSGSQSASSIGTQIQIVTNDGTDAVTGWFYGLPQGATIALNNVVYTISYTGGTGNDIVLTDIGVVGPLTNLSPYGVAPSHSSMNIVTNSPTSGATRFNTWAPLVAQNDIRWVRTFASPSSSAPGVYDWSLWDHQLAVAQASGVTLSAGFNGAPSYINANGGFPVGATALAQWTQYVKDIVTHTAGRVKHWEVWNEPPNFTNNLGNWTDYGKLVAATYDAVKSVDPTAQVCIAAVSTWVTWIKNAILNGAKGKYDYITLHPYEVGDTVHDGHEAEFMAIVPTVRKMLADVDPNKVNVPVWWTELGQPITGSQDAVAQANQLVKYYAMGLAQGVTRIDWFEPLDGDSGNFGLFNNSYHIRESGMAYSRLIDYFGAKPNYVGWVQLDGPNYGFVFEGVSQTILVTWAPPGVTDTVNFGGTVTVINPITGASSSRSSYPLTNTPILVTGVPASLVSTARVNKAKPFPWDGDYTNATSVNVSYASGADENGVHLLDNPSTVVPAFGGQAAYAGGSLYQQAEDAPTNGMIDSKASAGYTGTGYADFTGGTGSYLQFAATSDGSSSQTYRLRYANGGTAPRSLSVSVNGVVVNGALSFPVTGAWSSWSYVDLNVNLASGNNTIRLTATGTDGPNLDAVLSGSAGQAFTVDPNFLSYSHVPITITAEVRLTETGEGAGFNLVYESTTGFKGIGWNSVTATTAWQTLTWTITDTEFVGRWGYNFSFNSDSPQNSKYYVRNVTVTKNGTTTAAKLLSGVVSGRDASAPRMSVPAIAITTSTPLFAQTPIVSDESSLWDELNTNTV